MRYVCPIIIQDEINMEHITYILIDLMMAGAGNISEISDKEKINRPTECCK